MLRFGKGKPPTGSLIVVGGALASGWSFQGIYTAHSGFPLTPLSTFSANIGRADWNRSDRMSEGNLAVSACSVDRWR